VNEYLRRSALFFGAMAAIPFAIGFGAAWGGALGFFLYLFGPLALLGILVLGGITYATLGIIVLRRIASARDRVIVLLAAPVMLGLAIAVASPVLEVGRDTGTWTRLVLNRSHYDAIVKKVSDPPRELGTYPPFEKDNGVEYIVDNGPPVRVAFNPDGILDNWSGIVFDPTGQVMMADRIATPEHITKLFGGDLVGCRHLSGHYYECSFT